MIKKIPWSQPEIKKEELEHVLDSFRADWLTMGPKVKQFEKKMAEYQKVPHAVAVNNGTVALDIALKILGIGPGDEVIVPAMTYFATASAVSYQFAIPVFVDIERNSFNLDPEKIEKAIRSKTKAIIYIDYGGNPADIEGLQTIAEKHGIILLEDGAQSLGGRYKKNPLGTQTEISTMSFHMAKIMTTVEGGMIFTHNEKFATEARIRRNQGESGKYLHSLLGTNGRMTDMAAAIGLAQIEKLEWMIASRKRIADRYDMHFKDHERIRITSCILEGSANAYFFYPILIQNREDIALKLKEKDIDTRIAYPMPLYNQELYSNGGSPCKKTPCPVAEHVTSQILNLPIFPSLTDLQVDHIAEEVLNAVN